jgi:hypothetical protein
MSLFWIKSGKPQYEHMSSVVHPTADILANGRFAPEAAIAAPRRAFLGKESIKV